MKNLHDVLQGPRLTEKASSLHEVDGKVVFKVNPKANKIDIKRAVEKMFSVKVKTSGPQRYMGSRRESAVHRFYQRLEEGVCDTFRR